MAYDINQGERMLRMTLVLIEKKVQSSSYLKLGRPKKFIEKAKEGIQARNPRTRAGKVRLLLLLLTIVLTDRFSLLLLGNGGVGRPGMKGEVRFLPSNRPSPTPSYSNISARFLELAQ
uniref:hypothetical protein n=1 Tax=Jatropha curcas TaxID=180498 RepID=UPI00279FB783|nr:hypothetical protein QLP06_mgp036 [Jatropha curcas]WFG81203.1 hypothetical protein [Jatropha curcas]